MQTQPPHNTPSIREYLQLTSFTLFCFFAFAYNLSEVPPYHADENFYVTSTRNMIDSGDYITPTYHGKKRFAKPILFYWLIAASYKTFGISLFSARLVSTFFGTLCIPLVYMMARRMFDRQTAIITALLLPGCYLHFQISRWAITDMALNFFTLLALSFFIRGLQDESNRGTPYYLAYLSMAIGFMIKGPPAVLIPGLVIGGFLIVLRDWKRLSQLRLGYGAVILAAIILPWFSTMFYLHGDEFKSHILGAELRDRILNETPFSFYYIGVIIRYHLPWSMFFLVTLAARFGLTSIPSVKASHKETYFSSFFGKFKARCRELTEKNHQSFLFCLLWIMAPLFLFTLFRIEHSRYMLLVSPAIAMITAHFFSQLISSTTGFHQSSFKIPFFLTGLLYWLIAALIGTAALILNPVFPVPFTLISLPILIICGLALLFWFYKSKKYFLMVITLSIIQVITLTFLSGNVISFTNRYPMKAFANQILADPQTNKQIGLYQLGNHRARMGVLTGLPSFDLNDPERLKQFIQSGENVYIVMRQFEWETEFLDLPLTLKTKDIAWKKFSKNKVKIALILNKGIKPYLSEYSENYVLLKVKKIR